MSYPDCPFCRIVRGEAETEILHRTGDLVVFRDHRPQAPVHLLIVPVKHIRSINDIEPADTLILGEMLQTAKEMAAREGVAREGYRLFFNVERGGGQIVFHLHMHLMARRDAGRLGS
jgi:histidine triad (HIT) family protein